MKIFSVLKNRYFLLIRYLYNYLDFIYLIFRNLFLSKNNKDLPFTIGITTFLDRYDNCLKPLVKKLVLLFPENQIIITANGHVKKNEQEKYLKKIQHFTSRYSNVLLKSYNEPMGLSYLWNVIISESSNDKILILNDDVVVLSKFRNWLKENKLVEKQISTINFSWSHYLISKNIFNTIGPFDEGLLEIGGEDDDYSARLALKKIKLSNINTNTIYPRLKLIRKRLAVNSYGKNMNNEVNGYSSYNSRYLISKWEMSNEYFDGSFEVENRAFRYWKLKER